MMKDFYRKSQITTILMNRGIENITTDENKDGIKVWGWIRSDRFYAKTLAIRMAEFLSEKLGKSVEVDLTPYHVPPREKSW